MGIGNICTILLCFPSYLKAMLKQSVGKEDNGSPWIQLLVRKNIICPFLTGLSLLHFLLIYGVYLSIYTYCQSWVHRHPCEPVNIWKSLHLLLKCEGETNFEEEKSGGVK